MMTVHKMHVWSRVLRYAGAAALIMAPLGAAYGAGSGTSHSHTHGTGFNNNVANSTTELNATNTLGQTSSTTRTFDRTPTGYSIDSQTTNFDGTTSSSSQDVTLRNNTLPHGSIDQYGTTLHGSNGGGNGQAGYNPYGTPVNGQSGVNFNAGAAAATNGYRQPVEIDNSQFNFGANGGNTSGSGTGAASATYDPHSQSHVNYNP